MADSLGPRITGKEDSGGWTELLLQLVLETLLWGSSVTIALAKLTVEHGFGEHAALGMRANGNPGARISMHACVHSHLKRYSKVLQKSCIYNVHPGNKCKHKHKPRARKWKLYPAFLSSGPVAFALR